MVLQDNGDVLAQQSAVTSPLLFNDCRSQKLLTIDLRSLSQGKGWKAPFLFHISAATSFRVLQEE